MFFLSQTKLSLLVNWLSVFFFFNSNFFVLVVKGVWYLPFLCSLLTRYNSGMESANGTVSTSSHSLGKQ